MCQARAALPGGIAERVAVERGLFGLPGPLFGPVQERHVRLAFANAEASVIAQVPART